MNILAIDISANIDPMRLPNARRRHLSEKKLAIILVSCVVSAMGVLVLGWVIFMGKRKLRIQANATDNFVDKNKLGEGGFGPVYRVAMEEEDEENEDFEEDEDGDGPQEEEEALFDEKEEWSDGDEEEALVDEEE
ncbi:hypothetical protein LWI29_006848 [Acer saccharum]|uniref:Uncharacterized protein n=1 Tax=Acer saccharum TaxID=4024 RepID=A0AA39STM3_ACESA|nr:hypothetical protein LWI29_006848 [Acer saccharum]